jgi:hypothetical protein
MRDMMAKEKEIDSAIFPSLGYSLLNELDY